MKRIPTVLALVVVMIALPISGVFASEPFPVSGYTNFVDFDIVGAYANAKHAGKSGNVILEIDILDSWFGDIAGQSDPFTARFLVRNFYPEYMSIPPPISPCPNGFCEDTQITAHQKFTFTNPTILGEQYEGTLTMELNVLSSGTGGKGHWVILGGTGELKNLRGNGTVTLDSHPFGYEGQVHFDP